MKRVVGSASPMLRLAAPAAVLATLYFVTAVLTDALVEGTGIAVLWPASGVYLGVMLIAPHRMWRALALGAGVGSLAAYLHAGSSLEVSIAFAVPSSAEGLLGALLVERIAGGRFRLDGLRALYALVLGSAVVATALVGLSAGAVAAQTFHVSFVESWLRWWSADALGVIAVAPIITAPLGRRLRLVAVGGLGVALLATHIVAEITGNGDVGGEVYVIQAFLAVLLLGSLAVVAAASDTKRLRKEFGRAKEGSAGELEQARRRSAQLTAELAARSAELAHSGARVERLAAELRDSREAGKRTGEELDSARSALAVAKRDAGELGSELSLAVAERDRMQSELDDSSRARRSVEAKLSGAADELARARGERRSLEEELESTREENRALGAELDGAQARTRELEAEVEGVHARSSALDGELETAREEIRALETELEGAHARGRAVEGELEMARQEIRALETELEGAHARSSALEGELERAREEIRALEGELEGARASGGALEAELAEAVSARRQVEQDLELLTTRVDDLDAELRRAQREHEQAELALEHARTRFAERQEHFERSLDELNTKLAHASAERSRPAEGDSELNTKLAHASAERSRPAEGDNALNAKLAHASAERSRPAEGDSELNTNLAHAQAERERLAEGDDGLNAKLAHAQGERGGRTAGDNELSARYDERGMCLHASPAFARLLGYAPEELVGRPGAALLHPDDRARLARARAAGSAGTFEGRLRRKDGGLVWVEVSLDPVSSSGNGRPVGLKTTVRELSGPRAADAQPLRASHSETAA